MPVATDNVFIGLPVGQTVTLSSGTVTVNSLTCNADLTLSGGATLNLNGISKINGNVKPERRDTGRNRGAYGGGLVQRQPPIR